MVFSWSRVAPFPSRALREILFKHYPQSCTKSQKIRELCRLSELDVGDRPDGGKLPELAHFALDIPAGDVVAARPGRGHRSWVAGGARENARRAWEVGARKRQTAPHVPRRKSRRMPKTAVPAFRSAPAPTSRRSCFQLWCGPRFQAGLPRPGRQPPAGGAPCIRPR